jgi:hypothetical protein
MLCVQGLPVVIEKGKNVVDVVCNIPNYADVENE